MGRTAAWRAGTVRSVLAGKAEGVNGIVLCDACRMGSGEGSTSRLAMCGRVERPPRNLLSQDDAQRTADLGTLEGVRGMLRDVMTDVVSVHRELRRPRERKCQSCTWL
jgi:hypothetical protein